MRMTLNEYQALAQRTSRKDISPDDHLFNGILGLAGEAGECADLVKKHYFQDGRNIYRDLIDELGDVLWYVVEAAAALGVTLEEVAQYNVDKLRKRYPEGFDADRSLHREV
jgi:NTP pyrophosphatase (non-canonical NTP hydrolase)